MSGSRLFSHSTHLAAEGCRPDNHINAILALSQDRRRRSRFKRIFPEISPHDEGVPVFPNVVEPCDWESVEGLKDAAAAPRNRIVNVRTSPPQAARPGQVPSSVRSGEYNPARTKEPLLRLWRRTLGRYWYPAILLWLAISGVVLILTHYPLNLSLIDFRLVVAAAAICRRVPVDRT